MRRSIESEVNLSERSFAKKAAAVASAIAVSASAIIPFGYLPDIPRNGWGRACKVPGNQVVIDLGDKGLSVAECEFWVKGHLNGQYYNAGTVWPKP